MTEIRRILAEVVTYGDVMVLSTARAHGHGPRRLPDRTDRGRRVAAIQVETDEQAQELLSALDSEDRRFYLDVERKQDLNLMEVARQAVSSGTLHSIKPNDITVDALVALIEERFGPDLSGLRVQVNGPGNLGFKFALRLAETGCEVHLTGRNAAKVAALVEAINLVIPAHTPFSVSEGPGSDVHVLVSAVTAEHVVTPDWLDLLAPSALCVDVGINNLSPEFIEAASAAGHQCNRLDVRSAGDPLPVLPNPFFKDIAGRRMLGEAGIVAGGLMGCVGELVVDQVRRPTQVIGIANGTGGLLPPEEWSHEMRSHVAEVESRIASGDVA